MVLQLKVMEGEVNRGALSHHNQPGTVAVVGVPAGEVWAGDITRGCREDPSTFEAFITREVPH